MYEARAAQMVAAAALFTVLYYHVLPSAEAQ
jgi:hypothetical protein